MVKFSFKKAPPKDPAAATAPSTGAGELLHFFANFFNFFVVLMCVVILAVGFWFLIRPKYQLVTSDQEVIEERKVYQQKLLYLKQLNEIKTLYATVSESDKKKIDSVLSAGQDVDTLKIALLREIGYIGKIHGAAVQNMDVQLLDTSEGKLISLNKKTGTFSGGKGVELINVTFNLEKVDYDQLKRILVRFERSLRLLDVKSLEYDPALRRAKVSLYAYHLKK